MYAHAFKHSSYVLQGKVNFMSCSAILEGIKFEEKPLEWTSKLMGILKDTKKISDSQLFPLPFETLIFLMKLHLVTLKNFNESCMPISL